MTEILIQIISLLGCICITIGCRQKDLRKYYIFNTADTILSLFATLLAGGYTAAISTLTTVVRNILAYQECLTKVVAIIFVLISTGIGMFGYKIPVDVLPLIGVAVYTLGMTSNNRKTVKLLFALCLVLYIIYDIHYGLYVYVAFNIINIIQCIRDFLTKENKEELKCLQ